MDRIIIRPPQGYRHQFSSLLQMAREESRLVATRADVGWSARTIEDLANSTRAPVAPSAPPPESSTSPRLDLDQHFAVGTAKIARSLTGKWLEPWRPDLGIYE